ncbi:hypothetical protein [Peribacillus sp. B2I2]|uniref:hypothetical protein n=1 Tax=Peribacillus sp. B2I2 TaxID=3156468 RepID=UPI00351792DF
MKRFFKQKLQIEFGDSGLNLNNIEELYSRRNLIVHAGGYIDQVYADTYMQSTSKKGKYIKVSEDYFLESLDLVFDFIQFINNNLESKYDFSQLVRKRYQPGIEPKPKLMSDSVGEATVNTVFKTNDSLNRFTDEEFEFGFEHKYKLSDILVKKTIVPEFGAILDIKGDRTQIGTYLGFMKMLNKKGLFEEHTVLSKNFYKITDNGLA